jgi:hypothetical protein
MTSRIDRHPAFQLRRARVTGMLLEPERYISTDSSIDKILARFTSKTRDN